MFPIVFLGAAVAGGLIAKAVSESDSGNNESRKKEVAQKVHPQSYVVTPIHPQQDPMSAVEAVRRFTV